MGKTLELNKIYAIDDDTILNMDVMNSPTSLLTEAMNVLNADMKEHNLIMQFRAIKNDCSFLSGRKFY